MQCLILAGGLGTRMRSVNSDLPKTLLPVAGRPFAAWQLEWLRSEGIEEVVYCVGYLGNMIESFIGDRCDWGLDIRFIRDGNDLLGTAGALRHAVAEEVVGKEFFVLYGDSFLDVRLSEVEESYRSQSLPALMTVYRNNNRLDRSNVAFSRGKIRLYDKGGGPDMQYIDYGLLVLSRDIVEEFVDDAASGDLAPLLHVLSLQGRLASFIAEERFYEIGSPDGLADLEEYLCRRDG